MTIGLSEKIDHYMVYVFGRWVINKKPAHSIRWMESIWKYG